MTHRAHLQLTFAVAQESEMVFDYVQLHLITASDQALSDQVEDYLKQRATPLESKAFAWNLW